MTPKSMKKFNIAKHVKPTLIIAIATVFAVGGIVFPNRHKADAESVDELRARAAALEQQIRDNDSKANQLAQEADSLKKKIAEYDLQISQVQNQIQLTSIKISELEDELNRAQAELDRQKELLKTSLRALYKKGDASSFELLVGSQSFSQFVNEQEYLERLKSGIQKSAEKVIELKQQIQVNKEEQEVLLKQQEEQKVALDAARSERQSVLDYTQGQEANYRNMVNDLKSQQRDINAKIFAQSNAQIFPGDPGRGGYPNVWANSPMDTMLDSWGMYNRECVSYAAYKVAASGRNMPGNWPSYYFRYGSGHGGNARDWIGNASIDGIPYDRNPRVGDVAILVSGTYGHAAYVEQVLDGGRVYISQYNYDWNGNYSEAIINYTQANWYFIHF